MPALGLLAVGFAAFVLLRRQEPPAEPARLTSPRVASRTQDQQFLLDSIPPPAPEPPPPSPPPPELPSGIPPADMAAAERLDARLRGGSELSAEDLRSAEDLHSRHPETSGLLYAVLVRTAVQERRDRRYAAAVALLERALVLAPATPPAMRALLRVRVDLADWPGAERTAREILAAAPLDPEATRTLAYALLRQDRTREAVDILQRYLDGRDDAEASALLARIGQDQAVEAGLDERNLSHFHVRYDGDAHEDVGREILRVLERHYSTLVRTLGHQPAAPIPVILLSAQSYYDSTGAPAWAGGHYDTFDGRVRIPIGGLTTSLDPALEETVLHELTHAFVTDLSAGLAPREVQEGVAQLLAGHRGVARLQDAEARALANGRVGGVLAFYLASLAFVEYLDAQRGQGGINELLATMSRTRSVDAAFREVYGSDMRSLQTEAMARLRRRYGD